MKNNKKEQDSSSCNDGSKISPHKCWSISSVPWCDCDGYQLWNPLPPSSLSNDISWYLFQRMHGCPKAPSKTFLNIPDLSTHKHENHVNLVILHMPISHFPYMTLSPSTLTPTMPTTVHAHPFPISLISHTHFLSPNLTIPINPLLSL